MFQNDLIYTPIEFCEQAKQGTPANTYNLSLYVNTVTARKVDITTECTIHKLRVLII
jgi:hypothetical protein